MELGCFSVSLAVKDLSRSRSFYENPGFTIYAGNEKENWLIMKQGSTNIGLFQGMLEKNMLTFNPGWDQDARETDSFTDIRELQKLLKAKGITPGAQLDESGSGPARFMITDPDGNQILIDQHR